MEGWLKLHRSILNSRQFADPTRLKIWVWMLCKASIVRRSLTVKTGKGYRVLELQPGQFIFGRHKAEQELHIDESAIYRAVQEFVLYNCISIESNNQYSIITISQWSEFQDERGFYDFEIIEDRAAPEQHLNSKQATNEPDSNEIRTHNKNVNKGNKVEKVKKEQPVLFRDSSYFEMEIFKMQFFGIAKYQDLSLEEYHESALNWSNGGGNKKLDWIATVKNWMNRDLKTKNNTNGTTENRRTNTGGGNWREAGVNEYMGDARTVFKGGNGSNGGEVRQPEDL